MEGGDQVRKRVGAFVERQYANAGTYLAYVHGFGPVEGLQHAVATSSPTVRRRLVTGRGSPPLWARVGRGQTDLHTLLHVWQEECYRLDDVVSAPSVILDIGANGGFSTRWFAERHPRATVIAVEPDPRNVELLELNTAECPNVVVVPAALADRDGTLDLVDVGDGPWGMRAGKAGVGTGTIVSSVPCISMTSLLEANDIQHVDLLKLDIEGGEIEVLSTAPEWIDRVDCMAVELHDRFRPGCSRTFYTAVADFPHELSRGENTFVWR
jgi:FkbM family methyltransferase